MIYSRFGGEVTIIGGNVEKGEVDIILSDGETVKETYINELKADDGLTEIIEAIEKVNKDK